MFERTPPTGRTTRESLQVSFAEINQAHQIFNENSTPIEPEESVPMRELLAHAELSAQHLKDRVRKLMDNEALYFEPTIERFRMGDSSKMCSLLIIPSIESDEKTEGYLLPLLSDLTDLHTLRNEEAPSEVSDYDPKIKKLMVASGYQEGQMDALRNPIALGIRDTAKISAYGSFEQPIEIVVLWSKAAFLEACRHLAAKITGLNNPGARSAPSEEEAQIQALKRRTAESNARKPPSPKLFPIGIDALSEAVPGYMSQVIREAAIIHLEELRAQGNDVSDATILGIDFNGEALDLMIDFHGGHSLKQRALLERDIVTGQDAVRWADLHTTADLSKFKLPTR